MTRFRSWLRAQELTVCADVHVKHGAHAIVADRSVVGLTRDAVFFDAGVIVATGQRTGDSANRDEILTIKEGTHLPTVVGGGVNEDNVEDILSMREGVIIASSLERDGVWWNEADPERVRRFMKRARTVA